MTRIALSAVVLGVVCVGMVGGQAPPAAPMPDSPVIADPVVSGPATSMLETDLTPDVEGWRVWASASYLLGWVRGDPLGALVTTSPPDTGRATAGVLGQDTTTVLFGETSTNLDARSGLRVALGLWFDANQELGIEADGFILASASEDFFAASDGSQILARPFINVQNNLAASSLIAFPGSSAGSISVRDTAENLYGFGVTLRENIFVSSAVRVDGLLGYRHLRYDEELLIQQSVQPLAGPFVPGTDIQSTDRFATENSFHGVDLGVRADYGSEALTLEFLAKVAIGATQRTSTIDGSQVVTVPGFAPVTNVGGLLALQSNIGRTTRQTFSAVPELGLGLGWQMNPNLRFNAAYSILWWTNTFRPGDQIDFGVNPDLIPPSNTVTAGPLRPAVQDPRSGLFVQTLRFGLEVGY